VKASIIAVGSELLTPFRVDTNSLAITARLNAAGYDVTSKVIVGDDIGLLERVLAQEVGVVDLIVCTGGLGPTADDITRDAVARLLGRSLQFDESIAASIRERFARRGIVMPDINLRQAMVPERAAVIPNRNGTAPGLWLEEPSTRLVLLPGPPREMLPMLDAVIQDRLAGSTTGGLFRRVLKMTGRSESEVDQLAHPVYSQWRDRAVPIDTTILAVSGQIELHLTAAAQEPGAAERVLNQAVSELREVLGDAVYSVDGRSIEAVVGEMLRERGLTLAVAESCTGGLLASRITDVPGSSNYFDRGVVCYSNRAKIEWLGVDEAVLAEHGAVSEPVARAMAAGVRSRAGASVGIGVTGIAGPGGGTPQKPVGTVVIAVAIGDALQVVRTFRFPGGRDLVKFQSATAALNMMRLALRDHPAKS
jgi:nicotinamide-nucleotide amidase